MWLQIKNRNKNCIIKSFEFFLIKKKLKLNNLYYPKH